MTRPCFDRVIPTQILWGSATKPRFFLIQPMSAASPSSSPAIPRDLTVDSNTIPYSLPVQYTQCRHWGNKMWQFVNEADGKSCLVEVVSMGHLPWLSVIVFTCSCFSFNFTSCLPLVCCSILCLSFLLISSFCAEYGVRMAISLFVTLWTHTSLSAMSTWERNT